MRLIPPTKKYKYFQIEVEEHGETVKKSTYTTSEKKALEKLEEYERVAGAKETLSMLKDDSQITLSVDKIWLMYLDTNPRCGKPELKKRKSRVKKFVIWLKKQRIYDVNQINRRVCNRYALQVLQKNVTAKTYNLKLIFLRHLFKKIIFETDLPENPWSAIEAEPELDSRRGRPFTDMEIERIVEQCRKVGNEWYEFFMIAIHTGMRWVDCCNLKWSDFTETVIDGKNLTYVVITPEKTKRHHKTQFFGVPAALEPIFAQQLKKGSAYVLPIKQKRYRPHQATGFTPLILNPCRIFSDEKYFISVHCTRHTCATKLGEMGVDEKTAKEWTGLSSSKTLKIYDQDIIHQTEIASKILWKNKAIYSKTENTLKPLN